MCVCISDVKMFIVKFIVSGWTRNITFLRGNTYERNILWLIKRIENQDEIRERSGLYYRLEWFELFINGYLFNEASKKMYAVSESEEIRKLDAFTKKQYS